MSDYAAHRHWANFRIIMVGRYCRIYHKKGFQLLTLLPWLKVGRNRLSRKSPQLLNISLRNKKAITY